MRREKGKHQTYILYQYEYQSTTRCIRYVSDTCIRCSPLPDPRTYLPPAGCNNTLQFIRLFRYASASSSFRCSRKRPSLLSLACASGRLSFAVGEHYYCVYFLSAISFHVRTYADASFHTTIQARSTTPDLHTSNLPLWFEVRVYDLFQLFVYVLLIRAYVHYKLP